MKTATSEHIFIVEELERKKTEKKEKPVNDSIWSHFIFKSHYVQYSIMQLF